ncbi:MAG: DNA/RNA non-specific endonuclease [Ignavibacteria bacterium]
MNDITEKTKVIAVMMPNEEGIRKADWKSYTTTVSRVELSTGYNFLSGVPKEIQEIIEK